MRLNSQRNIQRTDFDDFTKFLGLNGQRNMTSNCQNGRGSVENSTQRDYPSGAKCTIGENDITSGRSLAMVYAPKQSFVKIYDPEIALSYGTIFEELNKPFLKSSCRGTNDKGEGCF